MVIQPPLLFPSYPEPDAHTAFLIYDRLKSGQELLHLFQIPAQCLGRGIQFTGVKINGQELLVMA